MTPEEICAAFNALKREISPTAYVGAALNLDPWEQKEPLVSTIYPFGLLDQPCFRTYANDWPELLEKSKAAWEKHKVDFLAKLIRDMAVAIIRITADFGRCTDANLRSAGFSSEHITKHAKDAAKDADKIASNGPFAVVMGTANEA